MAVAKALRAVHPPRWNAADSSACTKPTAEMVPKALHYQEKHQKSSLGVAEQSAPQLLPGTKSMQHAAGTRSTSPVLVLPVCSQMSSECFQIEPQAGKCPACTLRAAASSCSPRPRCPWHHAAARGRERHRTPDLLPLHPPPHQRRISCLCLSCAITKCFFQQTRRKSPMSANGATIPRTRSFGYSSIIWKPRHFYFPYHTGYFL